VCLATVSFTIDEISAVAFVFTVCNLLNDSPRRFAIGRCSIRLQIGLGRIEPVEAILDPVRQNIRIAVSQAVDLLIVEVALNGLAIAQALFVSFKWR
jgi:hypothetical protein